MINMICYYRFLIAFAVFGLTLLPATLYPVQINAQNRIVIKNSQKIVGTSNDGKRVRQLIGNVHLQTERMTMYSDSAYQYLNSSLVEAFGNIQLETKNDTIWCDRLSYDLSSDIVELTGRVIINTDSTTIFGDNVLYNLTSEVALFRENILLRDKKGILKADQGVFFQQKDSAIFRGHVQVKDSLQYIEADSLHTSRKNGYYEFYGKIFSRDKKNDVLLTTNYLQSDSTGERHLRGNSHIVKFAADTSDTTHIWAENITYFDQDTTYSITAINNVETWSAQFSSVSDTIKYFDVKKEFNLYGNPKTWHESLQLSGPYIRATLKDEAIDSLISYPKPFIVQEHTSTGRLNQMEGDTLIANFKDGAIEKVKMYPNAQLIRFISDDNDANNGAIKINSPNYVSIFFIDGAIDNMKSGSNTEGSYIPESPSVKTLQLEGFIWTPEQKPERPLSLPQQQFRILLGEPPFHLPTRFLEWKN